MDDLGYTWAKMLIDCINLWIGSSHAIFSWKDDNLPTLIVYHLDKFTDSAYCYDKRMLEDVVSSLNLNNSETISLLLDGLEKSVESIPLYKLYLIIRLLTKYCSEEQIADVTTRYVQRLTTRLKLPAKTIESECSVESALACQLYSFLGDVDTRVRWRAAHSIRALARMGDFKSILLLTNLYDCKSMSGYRENNAPFYWLSARLWLIVTFDRIASEVPKAIAPVARWLLSIATDQNFPHVLIRYFAKSCLIKILSEGFNEFNNHEIASIQAINVSGLSAEKSKHRISRGGFPGGDKDRRFRFDSLDTLTYVYPGAIECFANVNEEMFLDEAETWIIDRWKNDLDLSIWQNEPRKHKFERANYTLYSHSHGFRPTIERHSYYLEWHAMWCSLGSLMEGNALAEPKYDDDDYGTLIGFLRQEGLTQPPHWLSDLRCPMPLESRFYKSPTVDAEDWVAMIAANDFEIELGLASDDSKLVVATDYDIYTSKHNTSVRISSALVSSDTGLSLIRALQTSDDSHDYRLPSENEHFEINEAPYMLRGWLNEPSGSSRLDEKDTFNHGVSMIKCMPSQSVIELLELCRSNSYPVSWIDKSSGDRIFSYAAWSNLRDDSREEKYIYNDSIVSNGYRLEISLSHLKQYLSEVNFDLILEVEITRRVSKDGITKYDEESKKKARYARLYLLRRTGEIFTVEGCIGTWASPGD